MGNVWVRGLLITEVRATKDTWTAYEKSETEQERGKKSIVVGS
jgi:hypothetical protein